MNIVKMDEVPNEPIVSPLFTSSNVTRQLLASGSQDYNLSIVNFGKGVRNKFHTHDSDQVLFVTKGNGIVATEYEQQVVEVGMIILIPAGEKHWHGATDDVLFSHITLTRMGSTTTQIEE